MEKIGLGSGGAAPRMAAPRSGEYRATTAPAAADNLAKSRRENRMLLMGGAHARAGNEQDQATL